MDGMHFLLPFIKVFDVPHSLFSIGIKLDKHSTESSEGFRVWNVLKLVSEEFTDKVLHLLLL
jgi:hypothetical protein